MTASYVLPDLLGLLPIPSAFLHHTFMAITVSPQLLIVTPSSCSTLTGQSSGFGDLWIVFLRSFGWTDHRVG